MTLFTQLTLKTQELISQYPDMINEHLEEWIKAELKIKKGLSKEVINYLVIAKRRMNPDQRDLECSPKRADAINKLVKLGHGMEQFKGMIDYMVQKYWGTEWWASMITPEYLFRPDNFQRYLDEARENYQRVKPKKKIGGKNQYDDLLIS